MCPKCAAAADVLETRKDGCLVRRRRLCHNGHRFVTVEIPAPLLSAVGSRRLKRALEVYAVSAEKFRRDRSIYMARQQGKTYAELSKEFGIPKPTLPRLVRAQERLRKVKGEK